MMLSLLEVLHQLPAPQGGEGWGSWVSHGQRQARWAAAAPRCLAPSVQKDIALRSAVFPTAITLCINERLPLLYTLSRRTTAQGHLTANTP